MKEGGSRLPAFHPNLFTYVVASGPASTVPPSYITLGRACVAEDPLQRPTFDEVLKALENVRRDAERRIAESAAAAAAASTVLVVKRRTGSGLFRSNASDGGLGSSGGGLGQQAQGEEAAAAAGFVAPTLNPECLLRDSLDAVVTARSAAGAQPGSALGYGSGLSGASGSNQGCGLGGALGNSILTGGVLCSAAQAGVPLEGSVDRGNR